MLRNAPAQVGPVYADGVAAVAGIAQRLDDATWGHPVCGEWTATQTARHLLAVAGWYHHWLDRAVAGDSSRPFDATDMDRQNDLALAAVRDRSGPDAVAEFVPSATAYFERAADQWDRPFGFPFGTVTVGLHCGVAAAEWHIHAWDLSGAAGPRHEPADPATLFVAAGQCYAAVAGGVRGAVLRRLIPLGARRAPWRTILDRSGRDPGPES